MYHRLKNLLGASLMILAVVLSQIPMPEAQAEETSTVTFSMNGGEFNGEYNGYNFKGQTPVLVLDNNANKHVISHLWIDYINIKVFLY